MRLADTIFRGGHLSEQALAEVCMTGERPAHLERCDLCAERAVEFGRWLDQLRVVGLEEADAAFPPERLAAQQAQILRRLEQVDRPARVIAFPGQSQYGRLDMGRGIRPAWLGLAAAAGLVLGLLGGQFSARLTPQRAAAPAPAAPVQAQPADSSARPVVQTASSEVSAPDLDEYDRPNVAAFEYIDNLTPHAIQVSDKVVQRASRQGR